MKSRLAVVLIALAAKASMGQPFYLKDPEPRAVQLGINAGKVIVKLEMDRKVYLPDERARITVLVSNPTLEPLEIPVPAARWSGSFFVMRDGSTDSSDDPATNFDPERVTTVVIAPGQELRRTFAFGTPDPEAILWPYYLRIPAKPGLYSLHYFYGAGAVAEFSVESPSIIRCVEAADPRKNLREHGRGAGQAMYVRGCIFRLEGQPGRKFIVAVTHESDSERDLFQKQSGLLNWEESRYYRWLDRVFESPQAVDDMNIAPQLDGKLGVTFTTHDKVSHSIRLTGNREVDAQ